MEGTGGNTEPVVSAQRTDSPENACMIVGMASRKSHIGGFAFVQLVVWVGIATLVGVAALSVQKSVWSLNRIAANSITAQVDARKAFKMMSAEIRSLSPSSLGAYPIESATASSFTFFADIDNDNIKERIRYYVSGTNLRRGITEPTGSPLTYNTANEVSTILVQYLSNGSTPYFSYYDSSYTGSSAALTQPVSITAVRLVKVQLIIDKNIASSPAPITMTTQISLRNVKDNF